MPSDQACSGLIRAAVEGRTDALEQLLLEHHARVLAHIAAHMPPDLRGFCSAEDLAQETYIVVAREIRHFQPPYDPAAFVAWLQKIADYRRLAMMQMQRAAKRGGGRAPALRQAAPGAPEEVISLLELLAISSRTPSRSMAQREAVEALRSALDRLRADTRQALTLHYIDGKPVAEISTLMNRTEGAVHMLCNRGLKRLRVLLSESRRRPAGNSPLTPPGA